jgi:hypothetical protein
VRFRNGNSEAFVLRWKEKQRSLLQNSRR